MNVSIIKEVRKLSSKEDKLLIWGWIHKYCKKFENIQHFPEYLNYLCLKYVWHHEFFKHCTKDLTLTNDQKTVNSSLPYYDGDFDEGLKYLNIAVGNVRIPSKKQMIATWTFQIGGNNDYECFMSIGIVSRMFSQNISKLEGPSWFNYPNYKIMVKPYYKILSNGLCFRHTKNNNNPPEIKINSVHPFKRGDQIQLKLNTVDHILSLKVNQLSELIITENVCIHSDIQYAFALSFFHLNLSLTLIDFKLQQI